ncbi:MAG TPA: hypothetical protein VM911_22210 [Pyrinomonadaceae bacterium]|jgi:hypothetical protein|nr:hypothetical protein [Pyrinomonadaceae bacterium]
MNEPEDDTTEQDAPSPARSREQPRHSYYYDDATGYEIYDPAREDEDDEETYEPVDNSGSKHDEHGH